MKGVLKWFSAKSKRQMGGDSESDSDESCRSTNDDDLEERNRLKQVTVPNKSSASRDKEENFAEEVAAKLESAVSATRTGGGNGGGGAAAAAPDAAEEDPLSQFQLYELVFSQHLGVDIDEAHSLELILLARDSMYVLPLGWELVFSEDNDNSEYGQMPYYFDGNTEESQWNHPFEDNYRRLITERRNVLLSRDTTANDKDTDTDTDANGSSIAVANKFNNNGTGRGSPLKQAQLININAVCKPAEDVTDVYINPLVLRYAERNSIDEIDSTLLLLEEERPDGEPLQVSIFAQHLGVDIEEKFALHLSYFADLSLSVLPAGWEVELIDSELGGKMPFFYNTADDSSHWTHPFERELRLLLDKRRIEKTHIDEEMQRKEMFRRTAEEDEKRRKQAIENEEKQRELQRQHVRMMEAMQEAQEGGSNSNANTTNVSITKRQKTSSGQNSAAVEVLLGDHSISTGLSSDPAPKITSPTPQASIATVDRPVPEKGNHNSSCLDDTSFPDILRDFMKITCTAEQSLAYVHEAFFGSGGNAVSFNEGALFAQQLGVIMMQGENGDEMEDFAYELVYFCNAALRQCLPSGWEIDIVDSPHGPLPFFYDTATDESQWEHPYLDDLKRAVEHRRTQLVQLCKRQDVSEGIATVELELLSAGQQSSTTADDAVLLPSAGQNRNGSSATTSTTTGGGQMINNDSAAEHKSRRRAVDDKEEEEEDIYNFDDLCSLVLSHEEQQLEDQQLLTDDEKENTIDDKDNSNEISSAIPPVMSPGGKEEKYNIPRSTSTEGVPPAPAAAPAPATSSSATAAAAAVERIAAEEVPVVAKKKKIYMRSTRPAAALQAALNTDAALAIINHYEENKDLLDAAAAEKQKVSRAKDNVPQSDRTSMALTDEDSTKTAIIISNHTQQSTGTGSISSNSLKSDITGSVAARSSKTQSANASARAASNDAVKVRSHSVRGNKNGKRSTLSGAADSSESETESASASVSFMAAIGARVSAAATPAALASLGPKTSNSSRPNTGTNKTVRGRRLPPSMPSPMKGSTSAAVARAAHNSSASAAPALAPVTESSSSSAAASSSSFSSAGGKAVVSRKYYRSSLSNTAHPTLNSKIMAEYQKIQTQLKQHKAQQQEKQQQKQQQPQQGNGGAAATATSATAAASVAGGGGTTAGSSAGNSRSHSRRNSGELGIGNTGPSYKLVGFNDDGDDDDLASITGGCSTVTASSAATQSYQTNKAETKRQKALQRMRHGSKLDLGTDTGNSSTNSSSSNNGSANNKNSSRSGGNSSSNRRTFVGTGTGTVGSSTSGSSTLFPQIESSSISSSLSDLHVGNGTKQLLFANKPAPATQRASTAEGSWGGSGSSVSLTAAATYQPELQHHNQSNGHGHQRSSTAQ